MSKPKAKSSLVAGASLVDTTHNALENSNKRLIAKETAFLSEKKLNQELKTQFDNAKKALNQSLVEKH